MRITAAIVLSAAVVWGASNGPSTTARIFFLDIRGGRLISANPDGSDVKVVQEGLKNLPDGVVVDAAAKHVFWTQHGPSEAGRRFDSAHRS